MKRSDVLKIMAVLRGAYPQFYRGISREEAEDTVNLWTDMFRGDDPALVAAAVKSVIEGDEKGFPPTIGQVKAKLRLITGGNEATEAEAWELVSKAIRNGLYGAAEEFENFPPTVRRIVGSPNTLREWARMDTETVHSVVASNFQRSYRAIRAKEKEVQALPADVRAAVAKMAAPKPEEALPQGRAQALPEAPETEPESKAVKPPEWFYEAVRQPRRSREEVLAYLRGEAEDGR